MKTISILMMTAIMLSLNSLFAQEQSTTLEKIIENDLSKSEILVNAINWGTKNTVEVKKDFEVKNEDAGTLILNMYSFLPKQENSLTQYLNYSAKYSLKIDCRDNKFRATIQNPIISIKSKDVDMSDMSTKELFSLRDEFEDLIIISEEYFGEKTEWEFEKTISIANEKINLTEQLNKDIIQLSADKKNKRQVQKMEGAYKRNMRELNILNEIINRMNASIEWLYSDLEKSINVKDDF